MGFEEESTLLTYCTYVVCIDVIYTNVFVFLRNPCLHKLCLRKSRVIAESIFFSVYAKIASQLNQPFYRMTQNSRHWSINLLGLRQKCFLIEQDLLPTHKTVNGNAFCTLSNAKNKHDIKLSIIEHLTKIFTKTNTPKGYIVDVKNCNILVEAS